MNPEKTYEGDGLKAVVFDVDTILDTEELHKKVWEKVLNDFLSRNQPGTPPINEREYTRFIEGRTRVERVKNFLDSRAIILSYGGQEDSPGENSICALENKKSNLFNQMLVSSEVKFHKKVTTRIKEWKAKGIRIAAVSSDEKFMKIPETEEFKTMFDVTIDGAASRRLGLKEKPEADLFLEALKRLGFPPEACALFDSTIPGLQAGSKANFGLVAGVPKKDNSKDLSENGADIIVDDCSELDLIHDEELKSYFTNQIPPFAAEYTRIGEHLHEKTPVLFLDFDGTLTPIVKHPENANLSSEMHDVLKKCASKFKIAVVSGRDLDDLKKRVNIDEIIYAGSHGFRITGPGGLYMEHEKTTDILPHLDEIEKHLHEVFTENFNGVQIERKRYAIAVHYRNARKEIIPEIKQKVYELVKKSPYLKTGEGKMILEIKPDIEWHKGKAMFWILEKLGFTDQEKYLPVYIGDDVTDEDAYKSLLDWGISIQVGPGAKLSAAKFKLKNIYQVRIFLKEFINFKL